MTMYAHMCMEIRAVFSLRLLKSISICLDLTKSINLSQVSLSLNPNALDEHLCRALLRGTEIECSDGNMWAA